MGLSGRVFGFSSWSMLVPQALEGVAAVGVLYATVRRWFGPAAGLIAGAALALTPVATLMFRFNNPDALLVLVMTLAAYTITRAVESGLTRWVALTGALLGLGYLTKMLQAFLVLPAFALVYLWAGQPGLGKRLWQLLAGLAALVAAAGWWVVIDLLAPAADRPYVGGSTDNNILQLTFGYNGLGRITGSESSAGGGGTAARLGGGAARLGEAATRSGGLPSGGGGGGSLFGGATGITRLFQSDMGSQISWLLPAALIALIALLWLSWRSPRTDRTRAAALLWGGWLVVTAVVFSYMSGIIHPYYTVALAPAIAALAGIGAVVLWRIRHTWAARITLRQAPAGHCGLGVGAARPERQLAALAPGGHRDRRGRRGGDDPGRARGAGGHLPGAGRAGRRAAVAGPGRRAGRPAGVQHRHRRDGPYRVDPDGGPERGRSLGWPRGRAACRGHVPRLPGRLADGTVLLGHRTLLGHAPVRHGTLRHDTLRHGTLRHGTLRHRLVRRHRRVIAGESGTAPGGTGGPGTAGRRSRRDGRRQQRPGPAARVRRVRLPLGRGHGRLDQRGLARAGQ